MKKLALITLVCALASIASAQFDTDGMRTNAAYINANNIVLGNLFAARAGTNDAAASDGWALVKRGNKMKWENVSAGSGVTSVGLTLPSVFDVTGSPVTTTGSFTVTAHTATGYLWNNAGTLTWSLGHESWATNSINSTNFWGTIYGTNYSFAVPVAPSATNMVVDFQLASYQSISATNDINFLYTTNGPGATSFKIRPGGSDRLLTFPTNWVWLSTNYFRLSGSLWACTLTNAATGSGPRVGWFSVASSGADQTNVVAKYVESP